MPCGTRSARRSANGEQDRARDDRRRERERLDPTIGRFLSSDTVQPNAPGSQGYNLYAYVANNPTGWMDPSGESAQSIVGYRLRPDAWTTALALGLLFAATKTNGVTWGGAALLAFAVGVIVCYLDLHGPCWDVYIAGKGWVSDLGSAAAGAASWTADQLKHAAQDYPQTHGATNLPNGLMQEPIVQYNVAWPNNLPKTGDYPYVPPKNTPSGMAVRNSKGEYVDRDKNRWKWDPIKQEWDVQTDVRGGDTVHTNVNAKGEITHGPDNFPRNPARP